MNKTVRTRSFFTFCLTLTLVLGTRICFGQTTQPGETAQYKKVSSARKPCDFWTSKTMTGDWGGVRSDLEDLGLKFSLSYQQQWQGNFRGGLDTENAQRQSGTYDFVLKFDFEKFGMIDDAGFYFKTKGSWGNGISGNKVGALAKVNSDVNGDVNGDHPLFVKKWWYWQKFADGKIELRLGNLETNKNLFDVSLYANHEDKDFLNRASIRNSTIPHRTGIGAYLKIEPVDWFYFQTAAIDAQSRDRRTGFDTAFHDQAWFIGLWEFGFTPKWESAKGPMPGRYRVGWWYDPRVETVFKDTLDGARVSRSRGDDVGLYISADQLVWKESGDPKDSQGLGMFARYGHAHKDINRISDYWAAGTSYQGLIPSRDKDVFGFAVSQAIYSSQYRHEINNRADRETVYEWFYNFYLTPWCVITPDLQVVTNPGGDKDDRDAVVGGVRLRITF